MKIFDFTDGKKGELLTNIELPNYTSGWFTDIGKIGSLQGKEFASDAGQDRADRPKSSHYTMLDVLKSLNVKAICYCLGEMQCGQEPAYWDWHYTCEPEYARELGAEISEIKQ